MILTGLWISIKMETAQKGMGEPLSSLSPKSSAGVNLSDPVPSDARLETEAVGMGAG